LLDKDDPSEGSFFASVPAPGRDIILHRLERIVPIYLQETQAVLDQIDALPEGTVDEATGLRDIPIEDLFDHGNEALSPVLYETAFDQGRLDHDVAWLRWSAGQLRALDELLQSDSAEPWQFDEHFTNTHNWRREGGSEFEINVGLRAVSRFYCNLDIRIANYDTDGFTVVAEEICD
jgi:hypothetical protein